LVQSKVMTNQATSVTTYASEWLNKVNDLRKKQDDSSLKALQPMLAPWPDIALHALDTHDQINCIYNQWHCVLEEHVKARHFVRHGENLILNESGLLTGTKHHYFISTDVFKIPHVSTFKSMSADVEYRLCTPAWNLVNLAYQHVAQELFDGVRDSDLAKLSFWNWVGQHNSEFLAQALQWRPRFYGGPPGAPAWGLHQALLDQSQASAKARSNMLYWILDVTEHLHDKLANRNTILHWTPQHEQSIQAYINSWSAVVRIGAQYKRSAHQVNDLLGYGASIQKLLNAAESPQSAMFKKTVQQTKLLLRNTPSHRIGQNIFV